MCVPCVPVSVCVCVCWCVGVSVGGWVDRCPRVCAGQVQVDRELLFHLRVLLCASAGVSLLSGHLASEHVFCMACACAGVCMCVLRAMTHDH